MFLFDVKNYKIGFSFSFFALLSFVFCYEQWYITVFTLLACIVHEIGHLISMSCFGVKFSAVIFYCGGIKIKYDNKLQPLRNRLIELLSGVLVNFSIALVAHILNAKIVCLTNLLVGIYNLLPFKYFDGGQVLNAIKENMKNKVWWWVVDVIRLICSFALLIMCFILFYCGRVNLSIIITAVYIIISEFISI